MHQMHIPLLKGSVIFHGHNLAHPTVFQPDIGVKHVSLVEGGFQDRWIMLQKGGLELRIQADRLLATLFSSLAQSGWTLIS